MEVPYILLVDDDVALLQALPHMMALRIHGVQVDTARSAADALVKVQEHDYDAIVRDIKMPVMDGLELLSRIKAVRPDTPVLLITGHIEQSLVIKAMKNGAYDFIQKPIDRLYFVAALHRAVKTRQLERQVHDQERLLASYSKVVEHVAEQGEELETVSSQHHAVKTEDGPFQPPLWLVS